MFAVQADGCEVTTVEGVAAADGTMAAIQEGRAVEKTRAATIAATTIAPAAVNRSPDRILI